MNTSLTAQTLNEVRYYLMVTPCPQCGKGPWGHDALPAGHAGQFDQQIAFTCTCGHCGQQQSFEFLCRQPLPPGGESQEINPTDQPSRIIDLAQWLSLFYLLVESASIETTRPEARLMGYRATLCLSEALKFYGDNELPPESAFFSETTKATFRQHPENFARQKLRDMQTKLPAMGVMAQKVQRDQRLDRRRRWWRMWER